MEKLYCKGGGCTAKLGAGILSHILERLPKQNFDENLMVGFDAKDDAAVYKLTDDIAFVQTLDFFPPMVEDPYTFGQIAAANALSDIYAMGGEVKTALNIVCFPQSSDLNILGEIMRGGLEKVKEAGGVLAGGHSIDDTDVKYGLSVTGIVNPNKIYSNNTGKAGDRLILTKRLGVGIICTAARIGEADEDTLNEAVDSMRTLNKYACDISKKYDIHACTDITGFGFLGHLMISHVKFMQNRFRYLRLQKLWLMNSLLQPEDRETEIMLVKMLFSRMYLSQWKKFYSTLRHRGDSYLP